MSQGYAKPQSVTGPIGATGPVGPQGPTGPAGATGPQGTPLSRTLYVDGGTSAAISTGSIDAPYSTINAALTVLGQPVSVPDAESISETLVSSALGGYTSEPASVITIPAYRQIWIHGLAKDASIINAINAIGVKGLNTTGVFTWANTTANGGPNAPTAAALFIDNMQIPSVVITDDATVPEVLSLDLVAVSGGITGTGAAVATAFAVLLPFPAGCLLALFTEFSEDTFLCPLSP